MFIQESHREFILVLGFHQKLLPDFLGIFSNDCFRYSYVIPEHYQYFPQIFSLGFLTKIIIAASCRIYLGIPLRPCVYFFRTSKKKSSRNSWTECLIHPHKCFFSVQTLFLKFPLQEFLLRIFQEESSSAHPLSL